MRCFFLPILLALGACASRDDGGGRGNPLADGGGDEDSSMMERPDGSVPLGDGGKIDTVDSPYVDPGCLDGQYSETLPNASADISDLIASYSPDAPDSFLLSALDRRYPVGAEITRNGQAAPWFSQQYGTDCISFYLNGRTSTAEEAIDGLEVVVHECGHVFNIQKGIEANGSYYHITDALSFQCNYGDTTARGGKTFARSLLMADDYSEMRPPCGGNFGQGCDSYADTYLTGSIGDQGFSVLFEEVVQYVNSIATAYAFADQNDPSYRTSARDGILTFLWYTERYLKLAREEYPDAYATLVNDSCWVDAILTVWGRAWLYLEATKDMDQLTIDGPAIEALVLDQTLLQEIELLRSAKGCN